MSATASLYGNDLFGDAISPAVRCKLSERFGQPPFSVLSAREGDWQERKRAWIALGIRSEIGRGEELLPAGKNSAYGGNGFAGNRSGSRANAAPGGSAMPAMDYSDGQRGAGNGRRLASNMGQGLMRGEGKFSIGATERNGLTFGVGVDVFDGYPVREGTAASSAANSTSIFDPVLCELLYSWFSCNDAQIVDPFAGGSVRGIVASVLRRRYWGSDLSERQIAANREQIGICDDPLPEWVVGDSLVNVPNAPPADFIFSCPPYGDLERYSDDPLDLSTLSFEAFAEKYAAIIAACIARLRQDRFACFVVGDYRDKAGFYRQFPNLTIAAFEASGARLYNEAILLTAVGSLPVRITAQFEASRKLGKTHQNILVFCKGDPKRAAAFAKGTSK